MHRSADTHGELTRFILIAAAAATVAIANAHSPAIEDVLQEGDIILHKSRSSQAEALRAATGSAYTHVGLVFDHRGAPMVLEAVQPVKWTPLHTWIARGREGHVTVVRANDVDPEKIARVKSHATGYLGRPYDTLFAWDDERIYCSELVYKAYAAVGLELGELAPLRSFDLSSPAIQQLIKARVGNKLDIDQRVVSPVSILEDADVEVIYSNDPAR